MYELLCYIIHPKLKSAKLTVIHVYGYCRCCYSCLSNICSCFPGPVASVVMVTFSCRVSMFVGGTILTISYFVCAFVDNIDVMIVMFGIFGGKNIIY